jgi:2-methylcitrate dehydratase
MTGFDRESVCRQLARLVGTVSFDQLPEAVVSEARRRHLDALACTFAGIDGQVAAKVRNAALALGGAEQATIIGAGRRTAVDRAALVNCTSLRQLDLMDGHPGPYPAHASMNIPAIWAVAEYLDKSGADVLLATVLAYEINIRLQLAAGAPDIGAEGWNGSSIMGPAVAVGAASLLGLSTEQTANAIAIATTHAPTLDAPRRDQMPDSKVCMDGVVAASSIMAAFMAKEGVTGPDKVFEGSGGFARAVSRRLDTEILLAPMTSFRISNVYTKRFNGVKCAQTAVAAALRIRAKLASGWQDIERIDLGLPEYDYFHQLEDVEHRRRPRTRDTANHSIFYCVSAAFMDGDLGPAQFTSERLEDTRLHGLIDRVHLELRPELNEHWPGANPVNVSVTTRNGNCYTQAQLYSPGHPKAPLSDHELVAKLQTFAPKSMSAQSVAGLVELTGRLETLPSIRALFAPCNSVSSSEGS